MKPILLLTLPALLLAGCATSTIESRKKDRYNAYSELTPEHRAAVDAGQIKVGMSMDAVFIAWGKPQQVVSSESSSGSQTVWIYTDAYLHGHTYWGHSYHGYYGYGGRHRRHYHGYYGPVLRHDYIPVGYVKAEVIFEKGLVKQWRTLPAPPH